MLGYSLNYKNIVSSDGFEKLDTLRENCGIIRKQASTDGGVLWKVMCVDVVHKYGERTDP
ncbi:hypothetical protein TNCV_3802401 [Trichonephila clavipes]|nr:hypothetical protein TNCV_3802401 [Trichonephila clavipes]